MVEKVQRRLRDSPVAEADPKVIQLALDREIIPLLRELRQRFNELFDLNVAGSIITAVAESEYEGSRLLSAGAGIALTDGGAGSSMTVSALGFTISPTLTGAANTLTLAHVNTVVPVSHTAATALTVPPHSSVAALVGQYFLPWQTGAGLLSFVAGAGVTIQKPTTMVAEAAEQYSLCGLLQTSLDSWLLLGDAGLA